MLKEKLERCYDRLQNLYIQATVSNMESLLQTIYDLHDVYNNMKEETPNERSEDRTETDITGRYDY